MRADLVIVGGGLAGAALSIPLAEAGWRVTLIERERGPHDKVCGEFLSREAALYLAALGVDPAALGAVPISHVRLAGAGRPVRSRLPFAASSLSRRVLDEALLARAVAAGVDLMRGRRVMAVEPDAAGLVARLDDGQRIFAPQAVLATGKHDLRGHRRPPGRQNDLVGFKIYFCLAPEQACRLSQHVELMLFDGGYAGLEPVEGDRANLCLVLQRHRLARLGNNWPAVLAHVRASSPLLDERLQAATALGPRPLAVATIPYGFVAGRRGAVAGLWRLGDQAAVIPSFSGDGMSVALHSAALAAAHLLAGRPSTEFQTRLAADVGAQVHRATRLSQALVQPAAQRLLLGAARMAPALIGAVARLTRVPDRALLV